MDARKSKIKCFFWSLVWKFLTNLVNDKERHTKQPTANELSRQYSSLLTFHLRATNGENMLVDENELNTSNPLKKRHRWSQPSFLNTARRSSANRRTPQLFSRIHAGQRASILNQQVLKQKEREACFGTRLSEEQTSVRPLSYHCVYGRHEKPAGLFSILRRAVLILKHGVV